MHLLFFNSYSHQNSNETLEALLLKNKTVRSGYFHCNCYKITEVAGVQIIADMVGEA